LWGEGLEHWKAARLPEAAAALRAAVSAAQPDDANRGMVYGALGAVLAEIGDDMAAEDALESAVEFAVKESQGENGSSAVVVARYALAEHRIRMCKFGDAITATEGSLGIDAKLEGLLRCARAIAIDALGDRDAAREEAQLALRLASSAEQRARFKEQLQGILGTG
jgi:tetratricopeptide (TPR) repeat protein